MTLPACPARFVAKKAAILEQLARPDDEYADASPKGQVDEGVRPLLEAINKLDGFVTTSSCAGRVAVFLEGRRDGGGSEDREATMTKTSAGGKGGGGTWLYVSHDPLLSEGNNYQEIDWAGRFGLQVLDTEAMVDDNDGEDARLVHFKFEPMILHVLTASLAHAQLILRCASAAGFRESGAVGIVSHETATHGEEPGPMPMVAVRTMGLGLASIVGIQDGVHGDKPRLVVSRGYLTRLARLADQRFAVNRERTERFRAALEAAVAQEQLPSNKAAKDPNWEDSEARKARKRAEGLQRQAALRSNHTGGGETDQKTANSHEDEDDDVLSMIP